MSRFGRWMVNGRTESRARKVLARLGPNFELSPSAQVLELGAGRAGLVALLYERYHPARLVGTDFDAAQVASAEEFLLGRWGHLPQSVELREADALALPFPGSSFDYVFAMMMLHHVEHRHTDYVRRPQALREIQRVLRPHGVLVYSDMTRREEIRRSLIDLGFTQLFLRPGWRSELAVYRAPN